MVPGGCCGADTIKFIEKALGCNRMSRIKPGRAPWKNGRNPPFLGRLWSFADASGRPNGARGRSRTADTVIFSHVLYQLSYPGIAAADGRMGPPRVGSAPMAKARAVVQPQDD